MKTLTLPESEIITLADAAKKHGTVELAKAIGIGKTQLYKILRGHNRVTPETADKISAWLSTGIPKRRSVRQVRQVRRSPNPNIALQDCNQNPNLQSRNFAIL